jgi:glutathione S-transferase
MALPALATVTAAFLLGALAVNVGRQRIRHKVPPPITDGPEPFIRALRAQANTTEQALIFLPSLWICAMYLQATAAGALGLVWVAARVLYAVGYQQGPAQRWPLRRFGFAIAFIVANLLAAGGLLGVVRALVAA